jgi:hypothetical protein
MIRTGVEQAETACRDSRRRLEAERAELPTTTSVLHVLHLLAVIRAACVTGDHDWAIATHSELAPRLAASPLKHSAYMGCLLRVNHARLLLNHHVASGASGGCERLVQEHLQWIRKKAPQPFRKPAPLRILARLAFSSGKREEAALLLEQSGNALEAIGAADDAARDRYALGLLRGGFAGAQLTAIAALRSMGIRDPERDIRAYFPELTHGA